VTGYRLPRDILRCTFEQFRACGKGRRECQALWLSSWTSPAAINEIVHPEHEAHMGGFVLDDHWLNDFWYRLARDNLGVRIQVHTHPGAAFHSPIDDAYPIIHTPGFLSLVIPNFAVGPIGFDRAYLTEIQEDGCWREVDIASRLAVE
jgi:hypothetical protein